MIDRKWTPGPWEVGEHIDHDGISGHRDGYTYVKMTRQGRFETRWAVHQGFCANADAHLIAAAPDLYEALEAVLGRYTDLVASGDAGHWDCEDELEVKLARATLAKARGEA